METGVGQKLVIQLVRDQAAGSQSEAQRRARSVGPTFWKMVVKVSGGVQRFDLEASHRPELMSGVFGQVRMTF